MELGLKGKVAIVTGGTEGIGKATALMLAHAGTAAAVDLPKVSGYLQYDITRFDDSVPQAETLGAYDPLIRAGKVRALAVAADKRPEAFAKIPTFKEAGFDVVIPSPLGLAGPKGLPQPIVEKLDAAVKAALA